MTEELARMITHRIDLGRPAILEGVLVLDAIEQIGRSVDFLIFVTGGHAESSFAPQIAAYRSRRRPDQLAHFTIDGWRE
jgi:hypothetical protein